MSEAEGQPERAKIEPGLEGSVKRVVPPEWTLAYYEPTFPAVFSTPAMIGMMEMATSQAIRAALPPGKLTVGTRIEVDHLKAAPAGVTVVGKSKLVEVNGRFLTFDVEAWVGADLIGRGRIFHAIVDYERFQAVAGRKP
jgi:fluoroacetyl-CoA thioesterase